LCCDKAGEAINNASNHIVNEEHPWFELWHFFISVGGGLLGGLIAVYVGHLLTVGRDRQAGVSSRRREFLMFLKSWRAAILEKRLQSGGWAYDASAFYELKPDCAALAESVRGDHGKSNRNAFDALEKAIIDSKTTGSPPEAVKAIDKMIEFIESH